jgi:DNA-binding LacI/PurR family transcriptional regulator
LAQALELTTVTQPFAETGRIAATLLLGLLDGQVTPASTSTSRPRSSLGPPESMGIVGKI